MTNAVATTAPKPQLRAGGSLTAIVPQSIEEAYRMASAVVAAGMAPKSLDTAEKAMVAIMHGMEVGLTPMAAMQSIAVVNGFPTIWGDGALGLVRGSGLCEGVKEWIDGDGDQMVAVCEVRRRGEADPIRRTFSVADARKAGLWSKAGPWQNYPKRMLQMRARSLALRDGFADILRGLRIREEVEDYQPMRDVTPPQTTGLRERLAASRTAPPAEGFTVTHAASGPQTAEEAPVDPDTGEVVDAAHEPAMAEETAYDDADNIREPEDEFPGDTPADAAEATIGDLRQRLSLANTVEAVNAIAAEMTADLKALPIEDQARARKMIAEARQRVSA